MSWFAPVYDLVTAPGERAVLGPLRARWLAGLRGRVLEIGAGTGANLRHYDRDVRLVLTEPDPGMRARLRVDARVESVLDAAAESLPFADGAFDAVVATLVLCSVADPERSLDELRRVLRPGGCFVFVEHVAAPGWRGGLQRALDPAWRRLAGQCRLHRDPLPGIRRRFGDLVVESTWPAAFPPFLVPLLSGRAS